MPRNHLARLKTGDPPRAQVGTRATVRRSVRAALCALGILAAVALVLPGVSLAASGTGRHSRQPDCRAGQHL